MPRRSAAPVAPELDFDLCELCGNDMGMIPKGKVCCRLLKLNGHHESRTTEWKAANQAGFTREVKQTSGTTFEWTRRVWCTIRDFCHGDQFKVPGSTATCCKKHRDFFKRCQLKRRAEDSKLENEGAHGKKKTKNDRGSLLKPQLQALARRQDTEIASLRKQLKRKHDEVEALQAEVKKLRQVSATELAGLEQDFNTVVAPEWTQGGTCNETLIPRTSSRDLNAFIYGDFPLALETQGGQHYGVSGEEQQNPISFSNGGASLDDTGQLNEAWRSIKNEPATAEFGEYPPSSVSLPEQPSGDFRDTVLEWRPAQAAVVTGAAAATNTIATHSTATAPARMTRSRARLAAQ